MDDCSNGGVHAQMDELKELDDEALDRVRMLGGARLLRKMIEAFLGDAHERVKSAVDGARSGDLSAVMRAMHSLKVTSANIGAPHLRRLALELEAAAAAGDSAAAARLAAQLEPRYARVQSELEAVHAATEK